MPTIIRRLTHDDLPFIIKEHHAALPAGFHRQLGTRFLHAYYEVYLSGAAHYAAVAERGGEAAGFLVGILDQPAHRASMRKALPRLALAAAIGVLHRPALLGRIVRSAAGRARHRMNADCAPMAAPEQTAVLSYLVVSPSARGHRVGESLIRVFLAAADAAGCSRATLVTQTGMAGAVAYYQRLGWTPVGLWRGPGEPVQIMAIRLPRPKRLDLEHLSAEPRSSSNQVPPESSTRTGAER